MVHLREKSTLVDSVMGEEDDELEEFGFQEDVEEEKKAREFWLEERKDRKELWLERKDEKVKKNKWKR